mmetsp:Transcript_106303/g.148198  ORF Transcript_106303/g.148198 Transcript_106303/m.148198 type:complete len:136 (-) Transcript_106303:104-511(-)
METLVHQEAGTGRRLDPTLFPRKGAQGLMGVPTVTSPFGFGGFGGTVAPTMTMGGAYGGYNGGFNPAVNSGTVAPGTVQTGPLPIQSAGSKRVYYRGGPQSWMTAAQSEQLNRRVHSFGAGNKDNYGSYPYSWTW